MENSVYLIIFTFVAILILIFWSRKKSQEDEYFVGVVTLVYKLKGRLHTNEWLCEFTLNGEIKTGTIYVQKEGCKIGDQIKAEFTGHYGQGLPWLFYSE